MIKLLIKAILKGQYVRKLLLTILCIGLIASSLNCRKDFHTSPIPPTPTVTPSPTTTPSILPTPMGVLGGPSTQSSTLGYPQVYWAVDKSPYVTGYSIYYSTDASIYNLGTTTGVVGTYLIATDNTAPPFDRYFYVISTGTLPNSPTSRIVHAVSTVATASNTLTLSITSSTTPTLSITGGVVAGAVLRVWTVQDNSSPPKVYWKWGEEAASLVSVSYGFSGYGVTYAPALTTYLAAHSHYNLIVESYNADYWCIDQSIQAFTTP